MAESLGILVEQVQSNEATDFIEWLHVAAYCGEEKTLCRRHFFWRTDESQDCPTQWIAR